MLTLGCHEKRKTISEIKVDDRQSPFLKKIGTLKNFQKTYHYLNYIFLFREKSLSMTKGIRGGYPLSLFNYI